MSEVFLSDYTQVHFGTCWHFWRKRHAHRSGSKACRACCKAKGAFVRRPR